MIRVAIIGATGYTGVELLRLLADHESADVVAITSRSMAGTRVADLFPNLRGHYEQAFVEPAAVDFSECDLIFFATPHGVAQAMMNDVMASGARIIDLSADFRIRDQAVWESWYNQPHNAPDQIANAVYGLPELNREQIRGARLVANPGCYPTAVSLGFLPLLEAGVVSRSNLIASAISGVSGAGRQAKMANLITEVGESFKAYGVSGHRHLPEMLQVLSDVESEESSEIGLTFTPHLAPMIRGMHATLYADLVDSDCDLQTLYTERYAGEPFVDVMPEGSLPETRTTRGTNLCRIAVYRSADKVTVLSAIDNLTKGASGQAIQNMNIMFGLPEEMGLVSPAILP